MIFVNHQKAFDLVEIPEVTETTNHQGIDPMYVRFTNIAALSWSKETQAHPNYLYLASK